jgi:CheY-like chemotaxis protein
MLVRLGYDVVGAFASGEEALQFVEACAEATGPEPARSEMPDLVLMDIKLAGELGGIETAAQDDGPHPRATVPRPRPGPD